MTRLLATLALCALGGCTDRGSTPTEPAAGASLGLTNPTLIECPSKETKEKIISIPDPSLETVLSLDGTSVLIPAGALLEPKTMRLSIPASRYMEIEIQAGDDAEHFLEHFQFQVPIVVTISYARCNRNDLLSKPLSVWNIDPQTKALIDQMDVKVDNKLTQSVTFGTGHLSGYAVAF